MTMGRLVDVAGQVASDCLYAEDPVDARIRLDEAAVSIETDEEAVDISLASIFDVRLGPPPFAIEDVFGSTTATIAFEGDEDSDVVFVSGAESSVERFGQVLYRTILSDSEVAVKHPSSVGGRVTDVRYDIGTLRAGSRSVRFEGIDVPFALDVESVIDFSERRTTLLGEERTVLDLEYVRNGTVFGLDLAINPARKRHVLGRYLRLEYTDVLQSLQRVQLPDPARHLLVRLYARQGRSSLKSVQTGSPNATVELLRGLHRQDLVTPGEDGVQLTPKGWILVREQFDGDPGAASPAD